MSDSRLSVTVRVEVKFSTRDLVQTSQRERDALLPKSARDIGLFAVLFWADPVRTGGRWSLADAAEIFSATEVSGTRAVTWDAMRAARRRHRWISPLQEHVDRHWPAFLAAFRDRALRGHEALCEELASIHSSGSLLGALPSHRILAPDHRAAVGSIISHHGEKVSGHIFQDLLAYLIASIGYTSVTLNAVGVPDITLTDPLDKSDLDAVELGSFTTEEVLRLLDYSRQAGDEALARRIQRLLPESGE